MTIHQDEQEIQTLAERAKSYFKSIEREVDSLRMEDSDLIVGLDPKAKRYWVGKTESSILEQREREGNKNLIYFIKLLPRSTREKLLVAI